ncbi:MAG: sigma 54-interacting transcriptional regulator [Minicystis sp.]
MSVEDDEATLPPESLSVGLAEGGAEEIGALVILWSRDEPARAGEVLLVPPGRSPAPWIFGRGAAARGERRVIPARQRPGRVELQGGITCPRISREQLRLTPAAGRAIVIENTGRCPLVHEGREVTRAEIRPGEVVELRNELLLLCVTRPRLLPALPVDHPVPVQPFGEADASGIVGESPPVWELRRRFAAIARSHAHVLVQGASGTGKELVACAIHALSTRGARPMVSRNAATIPEGLVDAELFGNLRNYPNPGTPERVGLVGQADGSSLFLDELGELPAAIQARLLRVLDEGEYHRLGEPTARRSDFRLVAATNRPDGALKHDVLARFEARLTVPGLDARPEDVPLLITHLLRRQAAADASIARRFFPDGDLRAHPRVSPALVQALVRRRSTANVRDLAALLLRATLDGAGKYVDLTDDLRQILRDEPAATLRVEVLTREESARLAILRAHRFSATAAGRDPGYPGSRQTADLHLRQLVGRALVISAWDTRAAAALLAGEVDAELCEKAAARIKTFVENLERRLAEAGADDGSLRRSLADEWRGSADVVLALLDAIQSGSLRSRA